ncbi:LOW QUALITY PROTEIN: hypothetical protein V2J09_016946 [Rumex salicifolius]
MMTVKVWSSIPQYPNRAGNKSFMPRRPDDFGDGGAYPEIHIAQYPLGEGWKAARHSGSHGNVAFDDGEEEDEVMEEEQKEIEDKTLATKMALEKIVNVRLSAAQPKKQSSDSKFIKYKPSKQSAAAAAFNNSGAKESD